MPDQAASLRHLMGQVHRAIAPEPAPRCVLVASAERRAGTTSVAFELSCALVEQGLRAVLVDLDPHQPGAAVPCGRYLPQGYHADVIRRDIHEALQPGPRGIQWVPGVWESYPARQPELRLLPILRQCARLGRHVDFLVLDAGAASVELLRGAGNRSDLVLFVTSTLAGSVTHTYTLMKQLFTAGLTAEAGLFVNRATTAGDTRGATAGMAQSLRRFLGRELVATGSWTAGLPLGERGRGVMPIAAWCVDRWTEASTAKATTVQSLRPAA